MGSYLSEPITEKASTDESNDRLNCGASSMQGWRIGQEDAHNCILDFDRGTSFFAVYDGHGGAEVALYSAQKLPEYLKNVASYKSGDYEKALEEAFLGFDATIATPEVVALLKTLAKCSEADEDSEEEEENVKNLYEEAEMPIEQVIEKYTSNLLNPNLKHAKDSEKQPNSPYLKAKRESSSCDASASTSGEEAVSSSSCNSSEVKVEKNGAKVPEIRVQSPDSSECAVSSNDDGEAVNAEERQNGEVGSDDASKSEDVTSSSIPVENGEVPKKGKSGKALMKTKGVETSPPPKTRPKRTVTQMYAKLLDFSDDSDDTEDEEDKNFEGSNPDDSSDDDEGINSSIMEEASSDGDDEDEDDDDDEADLEEEDEDELEFARNMSDEPGSNSGCTAVVALLKDDKLFVANAGDSRCIVCRNGQAVEMSFDHKPEDEPEMERVVKAGGKVTSDGRVNGGLNLSRAIGDHAYKQNKELSDKEQMISAQPDVRTTTIDTAQDEFMVLACDGIWNFMSSQEVIDFVRPAIKEGKALSKICEEMFDHCLAPNTMGDGTGCDNMTAIIVQFKSAVGPKKRPASPELESADSKRAKTEGKQDAPKPV